MYIFFLGDCTQSHECRYYTHSDNSQIYNSVLVCLLKLIFLYSATIYSISLLGCLVDVWNSTCLQLNSNLSACPPNLKWSIWLQPSHSVTDNFFFSVAQVKSSGIILDPILSFTLLIWIRNLESVNPTDPNFQINPASTFTTSSILYHQLLNSVRFVSAPTLVPLQCILYTIAERSLKMETRSYDSSA